MYITLYTICYSPLLNSSLDMIECTWVLDISNENNHRRYNIKYNRFGNEFHFVARHLQLDDYTRHFILFYIIIVF